MKSQNTRETICWECKRAYGKNLCCWALRSKPVPGWEAEQNELGYLVKSCPLYIEDDQIEISTKKLAEILGVTQRSVFRYSIQHINKLLKPKDLKIRTSKEPDGRKTYILIKLKAKDDIIT